MALTGIIVLAALWLACAVAALCVAARLARRNDRRGRHAHGDEHAWVRPHPGAHERPPGSLRRAIRRWTSGPSGSAPGVRR